MNFNIKTKIKVNVFILLTYIFLVDNIFASPVLLKYKHSANKGITPFMFADVKCKVKTSHLLEESFVLCINNTADLHWEITNKTSDASYDIDAWTPCNLDQINQIREEYVIAKMQLHKINKDFTKWKSLYKINDFSAEGNPLPEIDNFLKKGDELISEKFSVVYCIDPWLTCLEFRSYFEYQIILNPKPKKGSAYKKYIFILKNSEGETIKKKAFSGAAFTIQIKNMKRWLVQYNSR